MVSFFTIILGAELGAVRCECLVGALVLDKESAHKVYEVLYVVWLVRVGLMVQATFGIEV